MKLNFRDPRLPVLTDKLAVREYVKRLAPELRVPKVLFAADREDQIPFGELPDKCVIKSNHGSGHIIFFERSEANLDMIRRQCRRWLSAPYGTAAGEWACQSIPRRVFGEELLVDEQGTIPNDYKIHVLNGRAKYMYVLANQFGNRTYRYYDTNWHDVNVMRMGPVQGQRVPPPRCLQEMIQAAERLASDLPYVRVDLYDIAGEPYFGELTFYPASGMLAFEPREFDFEFGRQLDLSPWVRPAP